MKIVNQISNFHNYTKRIESILICINRGNLKDSLEEINTILNGETTQALNELVSKTLRKEKGIFFTGSFLSEKVAYKIKSQLEKGAKIIDPACGAGNLLLSCLQYLPKKENLYDTINYWSEIIFGYDLHKEFIVTARMRMLLYAINSFSNYSTININWKSKFTHIEVKNSLEENCINRLHQCIIVNPPFGHMQAPLTCEWATGKVQIAGIFFENLLSKATNDQHIVAILPDVLRSGSRYKKWREKIYRNSSYFDIELCGKFDNDTDVDVFILHIIKSYTNEDKQYDSFLENNAKKTISDYFDVCVGSVVPHRDKIEGSLYKFLHAKNAINNEMITDIKETRKYSGRTFTSPFVVIHRTSSPSDKQRCKVTVINEKNKVAVENHLIVLKPKDSTLKTCINAQRFLSSQDTTKWLNKVIRLRHLTVSSIKSIRFSNN